MSNFLVRQMAALFLVCLCVHFAWSGEIAQDTETEKLCVISDAQIKESSGIALSRRQSDAVWIHNDSGDIARLFLVGLDGSTRAIVHLGGIRPLDWEDACSFTVNGIPWLMIGDVGDNARKRNLSAEKGPSRSCRLLLLSEPQLTNAPEQEFAVHTTIFFDYEDGPHNCESVAVDTERNEILLVSKSKPDPLDCGLYRIPLTLEEGTSTVTAQRIADLKIAYVTAMDIAPDGRRLVILAPGKGALVWDREEGEAWDDIVKRVPRLVPLPERANGETICFGRSRDELLLNSELVDQPLWSVKIRSEVNIEATM